MLKKITIVSNILILSLLCLFISSQAWGQPISSDTIGKVVALRGVVTAIKEGNQERRLKLKDTISLLETVKTKQGRVQLMFKDNTLITIGRNSEMEIQEYFWRSGDKSSAMKTFVKAGSFRVLGGAIAKDAPENFKTQTPVATIGILGSLYMGRVSGTSLQVMLQGGIGVDVTNEFGTVALLKPGYGTCVRGKAPEAPKRFNQEDISEIEDAMTEGTGTDDSSEDQINNTSGDQDDDSSGDQGDNSSEDQIDETSEFESGPDDTGAQDNTDQNIIRDISSNTSDIMSTYATDIASTDIPTTTAASEDEQIIFDILSELDYSVTTRSSSVPSTGISTYLGRVDDSDNYDVKVVINWDNGRFFALGDDNDFVTDGFVFGDINSDGTIDNVLGMGTDAYNSSSSDPLTRTASSTFGQLYESDSTPGALGIVLEDTDYNLQTQSIVETDTGYLAAVQQGTVPNSSGPGTETLTGFIAGVAEDMDNSTIDRKVFINKNTGSLTASEDLTIIVDKDNGTLSGTIQGMDFNNSNNKINALKIGSSTDSTASVWVSDYYAAGTLSGNNVIEDISGSGGLKDNGNFFVTSTEDPLDPAYNTNWGYWELAYANPADGKDYRVFGPGSLWIAGVQTPAVDVPAGLNATYTGSAKGVKFDDITQMGNLTNGTVSLAINFGGPSGDKVNGNITFADWNNTVLTVSSNSDANSSGFYSPINGVTVNGSPQSIYYGDVSGTYYGTAAQSIGGNFSVKLSDVNYTHMVGIFAGSK